MGNISKAVSITSSPLAIPTSGDLKYVPSLSPFLSINKGEQDLAELDSKIEGYGASASGKSKKPVKKEEDPLDVANREREYNSMIQALIEGQGDDGEFQKDNIIFDIPDSQKYGIANTFSGTVQNSYGGRGIFAKQSFDESLIGAGVKAISNAFGGDEQQSYLDRTSERSKLENYMKTSGFVDKIASGLVPGFVGDLPIDIALFMAGGPLGVVGIAEKYGSKLAKTYSMANKAGDIAKAARTAKMMSSLNKIKYASSIGKITKHGIAEFTTGMATGLISSFAQDALGRDITTADYTARMWGDAVGGTVFAGLLSGLGKAYGSSFVKKSLEKAGFNSNVAKEIADNADNVDKTDTEIYKQDDMSMSSVDSKGKEININAKDSYSHEGEVRYGNEEGDGLSGVVDNKWRKNKLMSSTVDAAQEGSKITFVFVNPDASAKHINGEYGKGVIAINNNLPYYKKIRIIGHEMFHAAIDDLGDQGREKLLDDMLKVLGESKALDAEILKYKSDTVTTRRNMIEEFMADRGGEYFAKNLPKIHRELAKSKEGQTIFKYLMGALKDYIGRIRKNLYDRLSIDDKLTLGSIDEVVEEHIDSIFTSKASKELKDFLSGKTDKYLGDVNTTGKDFTGGYVKSDKKSSIPSIEESSSINKRFPPRPDKDSNIKKKKNNKGKSFEELMKESMAKQPEAKKQSVDPDNKSIDGTKANDVLKKTIANVEADKYDVDLKEIRDNDIDVANKKSRELLKKFNDDDVLTRLHEQASIDLGDVQYKIDSGLKKNKTGAVIDEYDSVSKTISNAINKVIPTSFKMKKGKLIKDTYPSNAIMKRFFNGSYVRNGEIVMGNMRDISTKGDRSISDATDPDFLTGNQGITDPDAIEDVVAVIQDAYLKNKMNAEGSPRNNITEQEYELLRNAVLRTFDRANTKIFAEMPIKDITDRAIKKTRDSGGSLLSSLKGWRNTISQWMQNAMNPMSMVGNIGSKKGDVVHNAVYKNLSESSDTFHSIIKATFSKLADDYKSNGFGAKYQKENFRDIGGLVSSVKSKVKGYKLVTYKTRFGNITGEEALTLYSKIEQALRLSVDHNDERLLVALQDSGFILPTERNAANPKVTYIKGLVKYAIELKGTPTKNRPYAYVDGFGNLDKGVKQAISNSGAGKMHMSYMTQLKNISKRTSKSIDSLTGYKVDLKVADVPMIRSKSERIALYDSSRMDNYGDATNYFAIFDDATSKGNPFVLDPMGSLVAKHTMDATRFATDSGSLRWLSQIHNSKAINDMFRKTGGQNYNDYMNQFIKHMINPELTSISFGAHNKFGQWAYNAQTIYALGANVKNAAIQYVSVAFLRQTYGKEIFNKNFGSGITAYKTGRAEILKHAGGQLQHRMETATGSADLMDLAATNSNIGKLLGGDHLGGKNLNEWSMEMVHAFDSRAMVDNWNMARDLVSRDYPELKGNDFWDKVNEVAIGEIDRSQPTSSMYTRTPYQRDNNPFIKMSFGRFSSATGKIASMGASAIRDVFMYKDTKPFKSFAKYLTLTSLSIAAADTAYSQIVLAGGDERDKRKFRKQQRNIKKIYGLNFLARAAGVNPITGMIGSAIGAALGKTQYTNTSPGQDVLGAIYRAFQQTGNMFSGDYKKDRSVWKAYLNLLNVMGIPINNAVKSGLASPRGLYRIFVEGIDVDKKKDTSN